MSNWTLQETLITSNPRTITVVQDALLVETTSAERVTENGYDVVIRGIVLHLCRRDMVQIIKLFAHVLDKYNEVDKQEQV